VGDGPYIYVNKFHKKNLTTDTITTSYYLGEKLVAQRVGTTLRYVHQDYLGSTSVLSNSSGGLITGTNYLFTAKTRDGAWILWPIHYLPEEDFEP
jgi:hypothetical protein